MQTVVINFAEQTCRQLHSISTISPISKNKLAESCGQLRRANFRKVEVNFAEQTCGKLKSISQNKLSESCGQFRRANFRKVAINFLSANLQKVAFNFTLQTCLQRSKFRIKMQTFAVNLAEQTYKQLQAIVG